MSKVPQHLIEEARKRGIVPGARIHSARIHSAAAGRESDGQLVVPFDQWTMYGDELNNGPTSSGYYLTYCGKWAEVITPATSQSEGLKEGDSVECGPAMRAAIIELAKELGLKATSYSEGIIAYYDGKVYDCSRACTIGKKVKNWHTPEAFIAKMRVTAAKPKPIKIGYDTVKFNSDRSITVGCTTVSFATIEEVYNRLKKS